MDMSEYVKNIAESKGYYLCPDESMLEDFVAGLEKNLERHGYPSCPCREASGIKKHDRDIICPCKYCDPDVEEYGMCYCGLYVSEEVKENPSKLGPIPERRPRELLIKAMKAKKENP
ncbi:MAG: ferredoxin:thioredoxin reductase [Hadesarchaea archaeon]|nr:ferredoxin:thioredoxin reductase [Hadesarchaea archaeon]